MYWFIFYKAIDGKHNKKIHMKNIFSDFNIREVLLVISPFLVFYRFYNLRPIVESNFYSAILSLICIGFFLWTLPVMCKIQKKELSVSVRNVIFVLVGSVLVGLFISNQDLYGSLRAIGSTLGICMFFWLIRYKISSKAVEQSLIIILVLTCILHIIALLTFPNNIFGYSEVLLERAEGDIESRGIMRIGIPGQDFVILGIFYVLNIGKSQKKILLFLIPLFVMLLLRGTRTPLLMTILISFIYIAWNTKHKIVLTLLCITAYFVVPVAIERMLKSDNSDNILINYVKISNAQINEQDDDDIRVRMAKFYLFDFNDNILQIVFGNGVPWATSDYGRKIQKLSEYESYYTSDVGYVHIFVHYGLIGIFVYLLLLFKILKTSVSKQYEYAKLFVLYFYLVSITGVYIVSSSLYLAFGLYLMFNNVNLKEIQYKK